jgi:large subunit ribosomal protein L21
MKYAVIAISGTQYKVEENQTITVDKFDPTIKSTDQVLMTVNDDKVTVGTPLVKGASVEFEPVRDFQGEKLRVSTFKAKSRYRKTRGFRAQLSDIKITKINL